MMRLGPQMKHLAEFRDPDARLESSRTQAKSRNKFEDLRCNLLFTFNNDKSIVIYIYEDLALIQLIILVPNISLLH